MKDGIYQYEKGENPYDSGVLIVEARETEKCLKLKIIENQMWYSTYVDVLFKGKRSVTINKERSPHKVNFGEEWFVVYPNRMGCPLGFDRIGDIK